MKTDNRKSYILLLTTLLLSLNVMMTRAQADADTIEIETVGNYITIPVKLNGEPKRFILDTGCSAHVVFRNAADSLLNVTTEGVSIESSTGKTEVAEKTMGHLRISKYDSDEPVPLYITTVDSIMMLRGDGIVGINYVLGNDKMNMKIDVRNKHVIFTKDKHLFDNDDGRKFRTKIIDNRMTIKAKISPGIKVRDVVLDSGCDHLFDIDTADFTKIMNGKHHDKFMHQVQGTKASGMEGMYGTGSGDITALKLDKLTVTGLNFLDIETETGRESLLGFPFIQTASIVYYNKGKRIKVEPYSTVRNYWIVRKEEKVRHGQYTITYNNENATESWLHDIR